MKSPRNWVAVSPAGGSTPTGSTIRTATARPSSTWACRPNIDQSRENGGNRRDVGKRFRRRAAAMFDGVRYGKRRMVEGIFGAEETRSHRLLCRYRKKETQERFGALLAITWNVRALNRIRCATEPAVMPGARFRSACLDAGLQIRPGVPPVGRTKNSEPALIPATLENPEQTCRAKLRPENYARLGGLNLGIIQYLDT